MTRPSMAIATMALLLLADTVPVWGQRYRPPPPPPPPVRTYGGGGGGGGGGARTLPSNPRPRPTPSGPSRTTAGPSRTSRPANDNARRAGSGSGSGSGSSVRRVTPLSSSGVARNTATGTVVRITPIPARTSPQVAQARANAAIRVKNLRLLRQRQAAARLAKRKQDQLAFEARARELEEQPRDREIDAELAAATRRGTGVDGGRGANDNGGAGGGGGNDGAGGYRPPRPANDNVRLAPGERPGWSTQEIGLGFRFTPKWRDGGYQYEEISGPLRKPSEVQKSRSRAEQTKMSRGTGDHAGHRIGTRFGGLEDARNMSLQNANINTYAPKWVQEKLGGKGGSYLEMEDDWETSLEAGVKIDVSVRDRYTPGDPRPISRTVRWTETHPDGRRTQHVRYFVNPTSNQSRGDEKPR